MTNYERYVVRGWFRSPLAPVVVAPALQLCLTSLCYRGEKEWGVRCFSLPAPYPPPPLPLVARPSQNIGGEFYGESGRSLQRPRQDRVLSHRSSVLILQTAAAAAAAASSVCGSGPGQQVEHERAGQECRVHASERDTSPGLGHVQRLAL